MADEISEICMMEEENKVNIEETAISWMKSEPKEVSDSEENDVKQFKITVEYENIFGETSHKRKFKEDDDNLISSINNDVTETTIVKLENVKQEEDATFNNFLCSNCNDNYKGFCLKCSTLFYVLNNTVPIANVKSESNAIPTDILEIRETYVGKGVFLLRTLPKNVLFGPFEGITGIESTVGYSWKICDKKLMNVENGNWMGDVFCAANALFKNLDIYQIDGNLYFQTNREIIEGEELLIYYNDEEIQKSDDSKECLYTPLKHEKLSEIFACTLCCLGFGTDECLMEHKMKCPRGEQSRSMEDFELVECHYCKMWLDKQEHEEYHIAYCSEKHDRMRGYHLEPVHRSEMTVAQIENDLVTEIVYPWDMCSEADDGRSISQLYTEVEHTQEIKIDDYQWFSQMKHESCLNEHVQNSTEEIYKCSECSYQTERKTNLKLHLNTHNNIKQFQCDICLKQFTEKYHLKRHTKNKHTENGTAKDYKCSECSYETNYKDCFQMHANNHRGIKPFQCDICMLTFSKKFSLRMHTQNKHTSDGIPKNNESSCETSSTSNLQMHLNVHKKPHQCDICMIKYAKKESLDIHIKNKHTENSSAKVYKCSQCSFETNYKHALNYHVNRHNATDIEQFQCDICMTKFGHRSSLKRHMKVKHAEHESMTDNQRTKNSYQTNSMDDSQLDLNGHEKPYQCDICLLKFVHRSSLKRHLKTKHTENETKCN